MHAPSSNIIPVFVTDVYDALVLLTLTVFLVRAESEVA